MRRETQQRNAIHKSFADAGRPLSVDELFKLAQNEFAGLGIATVYRNLKVLQKEGQINQVDLPGEPPRWEVPASHHHHFLCRGCDKLFEVHGCPEDIKKLLPKGYILEEHDILLRGWCDACAGRTNPRTDTSAFQSR